MLVSLVGGVQWRSLLLHVDKRGEVSKISTYRNLVVILDTGSPRDLAALLARCRVAMLFRREHPQGRVRHSILVANRLRNSSSCDDDLRCKSGYPDVRRDCSVFSPWMAAEIALAGHTSQQGHLLHMCCKEPSSNLNWCSRLAHAVSVFSDSWSTGS